MFRLTYASALELKVKYLELRSYMVSGPTFVQKMKIILWLSHLTVFKNQNKLKIFLFRQKNLTKHQVSILIQGI